MTRVLRTRAELREAMAIYEDRLSPDDPRFVFLAADYASTDREEDALREASLATTLRPDDANVQYNAACVYGQLGKKPEALAAIKKSWEGGMRDPDWARRDPDLVLLHGDPEFERLFPAAEGEG